MSSCGELLDAVAPEEHVVQLCGTDRCATIFPVLPARFWTARASITTQQQGLPKSYQPANFLPVGVVAEWLKAPVC
jgi:hypothetical protein